MRTIDVLSPKNKLKEAHSQTLINMESAYKGEMNATSKYKAYSQKASDEGYPEIAVLFNAISFSESIHAQNLFIVIEDLGGMVSNFTPKFKVKTTKKNLEDDIKDEAYEANKMYPEFLKTAKTANCATACLSLSYAMKTEVKHKYFFTLALGDINSNMLISLPSKYYVCPNCGNTYSSAPNHCDFCLTAKDKFNIFE